MYIEEVINLELNTIAKVFPVDAPEGTLYPYCTYQASGGDNLRTIDGGYSNTFNSRLDLDLYCKTYGELKGKTKELTEKLKDMWNRTINDLFIQAIVVGEPTELYEFEVDCYRSSIEIEIFYNRMEE